jgi:hypothetical protein
MRNKMRTTELAIIHHNHRYAERPSALHAIIDIIGLVVVALKLPGDEIP